MKNILVTGANKGIGRAIVQAILQDHDDAFVYMGSRSLERGAQARSGLGDPTRAQVVQLDVSDPASIEAAVGSLPGGLYGVVNNAGIAAGSLDAVLGVNTFGLWGVCQAALPKLQDGGRLVNISSASGPNFVAGCAPERQRVLVNPGFVYADVAAVVADFRAAQDGGGDFGAAGFGQGSIYGLSKALVNGLTMLLARENERVHVNACTPGFIETDLTRPWAESQGVAPASMGMKPPEDGTRSTLHLLFGALEGRGRFYGSDALRSPLDRYRSPGTPAYSGD